MEDPDPAQRQQRVRLRAEHQALPDTHLIGVDVGLVESIEQYKGVWTERVEAGSHVCKVAEIRAQLHRQRDLGSGPDRTHDVDVALLHERAG